MMGSFVATNENDKEELALAVKKQENAAGKALGHLALHYKTPEDGPRAAKLLELMGMKRVQEIPFGGGVVFYQFAVADDASGRGIGTLYLSMVPPPLATITQAIRQALKVGTAQEHAAVAGLREGMLQDPEMMFHVGLMMDSLEEVERLMLTLRHANEHDPDLKGRLRLLCNKAKPGDAEIDARMQTSAVFGATPRHTYGMYGVQAFVETDLLAGGPLGESMVIELDFAFSSHPDNMFVKTIV